MMTKSTAALAGGRRGAIAAFSLVENVLACAIVALGLAGTYTLNSQTMGVLRMAKEEAFASQVLQQRVEHLRIANWQRISSPTWIRDRLLNASADGSDSLRGLTETAIITPLGATTGNTFSRGGGAVVAASGNTSLLSQDSLLIKWTVTWNGMPAGRVHTRETLVVLGRGGIAK
jgi:hypothetical protein